MNLDTHKSKIYILVFFLICASVFLAYFNSLGNPFIWDDEALVVKNTLIHSLTNLPKALTSDLYFGVTSGSNFWRPLQTISYIFDYHFWQLDVFGYHLTNILLQILASFLVFLFILKLKITFAHALFASLFFALCPLHSESVTYISGRAEMLLGIFIIFSFLCFIRSQENIKRSNLFYSFSVAGFIFALLSKEIALVYPIIIFGYIYYFQHDRLKERRYLLYNILPFIAITIIYLCLRLSVFNFSTLRAPSLTNVAWFVRASILPKIIFTYIKLLVLPVGLHMSRELVRPVSVFGILFSVFLLGAIIFTAARVLRFRQENKVASFMLFWSLVFFIPQSGIFPINAFVAEHFIYLSSISFYLLLAYLLHKYLRKELFILVSILICVFYILLTAGRNYEWKNPIIFYQNIIKYSPDSFQAYNNLGLSYERLGKLDLAEIAYKKALKIKPDLIEGRSNLANLYFKLKLYKQASLEYELLEKDKLGAKAGEIENNLGNIYEVTGKADEAVKKYILALKLDPSLKFTHFNLARIYYAKGRIEEAVSHILESLGQNNVDIARRKVIADFLKAAGQVNNGAEFYNNLGINLAANNYWLEAINAFGCAIELAPTLADYSYNLGFAYLNIGQKLKAKYALKQALAINPNHLRAKELMIKLRAKK